MQKHVHIRDMRKPKEMSKNSKHPHPHGNLNHKVDDDCYKFAKVSEDMHKSPT
jgi:hypothetical protein